MNPKPYLLGAAICLGLASPAAAGTYKGLTMAELKGIFAANGKATTDVTSDTIRVTDGPLVLLTQCPEDETKCYEIQIYRDYSNVHPTADAVNEWNASTSIPEASVDSDKDLHMEYWVSAIGLTDEGLMDDVEWFEGALNQDDTLEFWSPYMDKGK